MKRFDAIGRGFGHGLIGSALLVVLAEAAFAQDDEELEFLPNYRDTDLMEITNAVAGATGRTIIVDQRVRGQQINLFSSESLSADELWQVYLQVLQNNQLLAIESEGVWRIAPDANLRLEASRVGRGTGAEVVTDTIELQNVQAAPLVPVLRPMMNTSAHLTAATGAANVLVVTDRADNLERLIQVIERIDRAGAQDVELVPLEYASAEEVATTLNQMVQGQAAGGGPLVQAIPDERTNSVLLTGTPSQLSRYGEVARSLDSPSMQGGGSQVRYLNYADAETIAGILGEQFGGVVVEDAEAAAQPTGGGVSISFDVNTNSLVMNAPSRVLQDMLSIVDALDIPRAQVHVQAIIVEMSQDRAAELGLTWIIDGTGGDSAAALTNFSGTTGGILDLAAIGAGGEPNPSAIGDGITAAIGNLSDSGTSWAAVVRALAGDGNTNVISLPEIVVLDNAEATISVGQEVPFRQGQFTDAGGQGSINPFTTIDRQNVGTTLAITPRINEGTGMRLSIEQETSSIAASEVGAADIITNERSILTEVFVNDGDILVLGGLIDDQLRESEQRVPGLGRIPGLRWLFSARRTQRVKSNLMVFIRPTILRDSIDASRLSGTKYRYLQDLEREQSDEPVRLMRDVERPSLPNVGEDPVTEE